MSLPSASVYYIGPTLCSFERMTCSSRLHFRTGSRGLHWVKENGVCKPCFGLSCTGHFTWRVTFSLASLPSTTNQMKWPEGTSADSSRTGGIVWRYKVGNLKMNKSAQVDPHRTRNAVRNKSGNRLVHSCSPVGFHLHTVKALWLIPAFRTGFIIRLVYGSIYF